MSRSCNFCDLLSQWSPDWEFILLDHGDLELSVLGACSEHTPMGAYGRICAVVELLRLVPLFVKSFEIGVVLQGFAHIDVHS